jgi:hypothetical protein
MVEVLTMCVCLDVCMYVCMCMYATRECRQRRYSAIQLNHSRTVLDVALVYVLYMQVYIVQVDVRTFSVHWHSSNSVLS